MIIIIDLITFGWSSSDKIEISRKVVVDIPPKLSSESIICLMATDCWVNLSRPLYTFPKAPSPNFSNFSYLCKGSFELSCGFMFKSQKIVKKWYDLKILPESFESKGTYFNIVI